MRTSGHAGIFFVLFALVAGCQGGHEYGLSAVLGTDVTPPVVGGDCDKGRGRICMGTKFVAYVDGSGSPTITLKDAAETLEGMNTVWNQCRIGFRIENFLVAKPEEHGLEFNTRDSADLAAIRRKFSDSRTLLVVVTGEWNRSGTLGRTSANAWTTMPGSGPYGAVLEKPVGANANLISHELGHYLNLHHINDDHDLMNPIIYTRSTRLSDGQCESARSAAKRFWPNMLR